MIGRQRHAVAGGVAAVVALGVTELVGGALPRTPSMLDSVGTVVIAIVPHAVSSLAIETFGTADKTALLVGTALIAILLGVAAGSRSARSPLVLPATLIAAGIVGIASSWRDPRTSTLGVAAALTAGVVAGTLAHRQLLRTAPATTAPADDADSGVAGGAPPARNRREFLVIAGALGVGGAIAGVSGRRLGRPGKAAAARAQITLPAVQAPLATPVAATSFATAGITPLITPIRGFYRIDTALVPPDVDPASWHLDVTGMVDRPFRLTHDELMAMTMVESDVTIACVSNEIGGDLVGTARWQGVPLRDLLDRAGVHAGADQLVGRSVDGFTAGFPTSTLDGDRTALVAVAMNGEPLPVRHGFPARLIIAGLYGYVSATKWLSQIELTTFEKTSTYWIDRGWAVRAPIKTAARIDVPRGSGVVAGKTMIAGVAWAPTRGIESVEVRVDGGPWQEAELAQPLNDETWRQWRMVWNAPPGRHTLEVRATDGHGHTQTARKAEPFPDGATGYHRVTVRVAKS